LVLGQSDDLVKGSNYGQGFRVCGLVLQVLRWKSYRM